MKLGIVRLRNGFFAIVLSHSRSVWRGELLKEKFPLYWNNNGDEISGYKDLDIMEFKRGDEKGDWPNEM
jgi:hypothetical protein